MIRANLTAVTHDHVAPIAAAIAGMANNDRQKTIELSLQFSPTISEVVTTGQFSDGQTAMLGAAAQPLSELNELIKSGRATAGALTDDVTLAAYVHH